MGEISFGADAQAFSDATIYVWLEDVSNADAPAIIVAEQILYSVAYTPDSLDTVHFSVVGQRLDTHTSYAIRIHVDMDRDGLVSRGDYITMWSYPVLTFGHPRQVVVSVSKV